MILGSECNLPLSSIIHKLQAYCAYQDRCTSEVLAKLDQYELSSENVEKVLQSLRNDKFLDDKRFAESFCTGKFKIKKWGRLKIKQTISVKKIDPSLVQYGMSCIDADEYWQTLLLLAARKWEEVKSEKDPYKRKVKTMRFLAQRGFEQDLIYSAVEEITKV